jgi:16S rRNA processing protein RimM
MPLSGTIIGPHGVHGAVKLSSITDFPQQRLCQSGVRHLKPPNRRSPRQVTLKEGRLFQSPPAGSDSNPIYLIELDGIEGRDDASKLKGCVLYCLEEEAVDDYLDKNEYIVSDLVGLNVFLSEDSEDAIGKGFEDLFVGFIDGVVLGSDMCTIPGLGQDMLEIALPSEFGGQSDDRVLVPFVPQIVHNVDLEGRMVVIDPPSGLLDLSYRREVKVKIKGLLPETSSYQLR